MGEAYLVESFRHESNCGAEEAIVERIQEFLFYGAEVHFGTVFYVVTGEIDKKLISCIGVKSGAKFDRLA